MKTHPNACSLIGLAKYDNCSVEYRHQCGVVHVQVHFLTIKIERESLPDLGNILSQAENRLAGLEMAGVFPNAVVHSQNAENKLH